MEDGRPKLSKDVPSDRESSSAMPFDMERDAEKKRASGASVQASVSLPRDGFYSSSTEISVVMTRDVHLMTFEPAHGRLPRGSSEEDDRPTVLSGETALQVRPRESAQHGEAPHTAHGTRGRVKVMDPQHSKTRSAAPESFAGRGAPASATTHWWDCPVLRGSSACAVPPPASVRARGMPSQSR